MCAGLELRGRGRGGVLGPTQLLEALVAKEMISLGTGLESPEDPQPPLGLNLSTLSSGLLQALLGSTQFPSVPERAAANPTPDTQAARR